MLHSIRLNRLHLQLVRSFEEMKDWKRLTSEEKASCHLSSLHMHAVTLVTHLGKHSTSNVSVLGSYYRYL